MYNNNNKRDFVNAQQKKFYLISRAFKIGNILATIISISASKLQGETLVEKSIEEGRFNASKEADKIMGEAEKKSQTISIQLDQQTIKKIIEIFLSGM